jgi:hypothetical protein
LPDLEINARVSKLEAEIFEVYNNANSVPLIHKGTFFQR